MKQLQILFLTLIFSMCLPLLGNAQEDAPAFGSELTLDTDNDAFIPWENFDRYYTYGFGARYSFRAEQLIGLQNWFDKKQAFYFSAGFRSEGYTPTHAQSREEEEPEEELDFDRPFAGVLYGTFDANYIFQRSYVRFGMLAGLMGPSALSGDIQEWIHDNIIVGGDLDGWAFQIPDQAIFNIDATYGQQLIPEPTWYDIFWESRARVGNLYIDGTTKLGLRIGRFGSYARSISSGNGLLSANDRSSFFYQGSFSVTASAFDGTAQGDLFDQDYEYAVDRLNPVYSTMTHGVYWANRRLTLGFDCTFNYGKVLENSRHIYGRIDFRYRLR